jgi:hypothetical protein
MSDMSKSFLALSFAVLTLAACASRNEIPLASAQDDDSYCRANNVQVGSPEYIACRRDRDAQHSSAIARADRRQRDLGEYMLNHPDHP